MKKGIIGILAGILLMVFGSVGYYNGLVEGRENITSKWSQVENQLQRRSDLIPNLVNTVQGYTAHEAKVFQDVSDARARLAGAASLDDIAAADGELTAALGRLIAIAESYPELKSSDNFIQLQDELAGTENRLAVARQDYNNAVQEYNTDIKTFPGSIYAGAFGFDAQEYFKVSDEAKEKPEVKF